MRIAFVVLAAIAGMGAGGCYMRPGEAPRPATAVIATPAPVMPTPAKPAPATPAPATPAAASPTVEVANLPDFRPETAAPCNTIRMSVAVAADGALSVNNAPVDLAGLKAAASKKNNACQYVAAPVNLSIAPGAPGKRADEIRDVLAAAIRNLALIE